MLLLLAVGDMGSKSKRCGKDEVLMKEVGPQFGEVSCVCPSRYLIARQAVSPTANKSSPTEVKGLFACGSDTKL